ncbi:MAG: S-layer homology domain-containing protein, partial [Ezakiella sp.]
DLDLNFVAIAEDGTQYSIDKIPADTRVKLVEVGLPDGFERKGASDEYITFSEDTNFDFEYVNTKVIPANENDTKDGYVNITFDAADNGVLNAPGFNNVKKISYLVKEAYQVSDFKFYIPDVAADKDYKFTNWDKSLPSKRFAKSEDLLAQYEYVGVIVPPTPDEPIIPEPDYPIIPDYPVIPHRPHRPTTPTKDIVKEPTKPVETTKPVEEKKDYGIVETVPTIAATFSDLPENEAAGSIMNMVARGILKGMDNGKFEGELPITRAMVATVLKRLSKDQRINNVSNFTDVKDTDWFAEAVKWAQSQGLIKGYEDGTFKANNLVTRQELAVIIERFLKIHGITMEEIKELSYKDLDTLPAWSRDAIIAMAKIGLVEGQTEEMYNPASEFTREELAVMLEKIIIWVEKH